MTFHEYIAKCEQYYNSIPAWRKGQTYWNVLDGARPDLTERLRATKLDPFYNDDLLPAFLSWVEQEW